MTARWLTFVAAALVAAFCVSPLSADEPVAGKDGWMSLFNGKDLSGWTPKIRGYELGENFADTFRVEDGYLTVSYDGYDNFKARFGHIFYKTPFSKYKFRCEYRFTGEQCPGGAGWATKNSGVMIHGQDPATMTKDQSFPVSIEVQLLGGLGSGKRPTGNLCTPGTHVVMGEKLHTPHCTSSTSETYADEQWVTLELEVNGSGVIRHFINGKEVLSYEKPQLDPNDADAKRIITGDDLVLTGGTISLQSESHPVQFRNIMIKPLEE